MIKFYSTLGLCMKCRYLTKRSILLDFTARTSVVKTVDVLKLMAEHETNGAMNADIWY